MRGTRRRRPVAGVLVGDRLRVSFPPSMSLEQAREIADELRERMQRRLSRDGIDLARRARDLARRHDLPQAASVAWAENQVERWGSCTCETRTVRVSSRLAGYPLWVLDYVLVHELAHLVEPNHGHAFNALVARYPLAERARGFLIAKDLDPDPEPDIDSGGEP